MTALEWAGASGPALAGRLRRAIALVALAVLCEIASLWLPYYGDGVRLVSDASQVAFNAPIVVGWLVVALCAARARSRMWAAGVALAVTAVQASYLLHSVGDVRRGASIGPGLGIEVVGVALALVALNSLWRLTSAPISLERSSWSVQQVVTAASGMAAVAAWSAVQYLPTTRLEYRIATTSWNASGDHSLSRTCCSALAGRDFVSVTATVAVATLVILAVASQRAAVQIASHLGLALALAADEIAVAVHRYVYPPTAAITGLSNQSIHDYGVSVSAAFTGTYWVGVAALVVLALSPCFRLRLPSPDKAASKLSH